MTGSQPPSQDGQDDPRVRIPDELRAQAKPAEHPSASRRTSFGDTARAWGLALDLVFTSLGGFVLGFLFDRWQGTGPWGAVIGLAIGFITAAVRLVRTTQRDLAAKGQIASKRREPRED